MLATLVAALPTYDPWTAGERSDREENTKSSSGSKCSPTFEHACDRCQDEMGNWHPELPCFAGPCLPGSSIKCSGTSEGGFDWSRPPHEDEYCLCKHVHGATEAGEAEDHCARFVAGEAKQCTAASSAGDDDSGWLSNKTGDGGWGGRAAHRLKATALQPPA